MDKIELKNSKSVNYSFGREVDTNLLVNPFPGLRSFNIDENYLFFGREGQSDEILQKLEKNKFVSILGVSGSGKSSLVYCGVVPTIHGGYLSNLRQNWNVVTTRPGNSPLNNLAEALLAKNKDYLNKNREEKIIQSTIVSTFLSSSSLGLVEIAEQLDVESKQNLLIIVDQFEELFRFRGRNASHFELEESSMFVNLLIEAVNQTKIPIYVVITMRSDFIGECAQFPDLTHKINDSHYLIPQMTRDQKKRAIEAPIAVGGGKISSRLVQQLLNDVGEQPDQLPILQHALMRTWTYWTQNQKPGESIDLRHYNAIGRLQEALSIHANEAYDLLNKRQQKICEVLFKALTEKNADSNGIRRPTKLSVIASIAGVSEDEIIGVIEKFRDPDRSLLMPSHNVPINSNTIIDISHESLMRIWLRLKKWLDEEYKASEMYLKLSDAAERYQEGRSGLWQMPDLQLALNWREENKPTLIWGQRYAPAFERTMVFLETSENAFLTQQKNREYLQKRQLQRMRLTTFILALAALISITFVIYANIKATQAEKNLLEAQKQKKIADEEKDKANYQFELATKAAREAQESQAKEQEQRQRAEEAFNVARRNEQRAVEQTKIANEALKQAEIEKENANNQREIAEKQTIIAKDNQIMAETASKQANDLRYQSVAKSMALKSKSIQAVDPATADLKAMVAGKALDFYEKYKTQGKDYNGDIYASLYDAVRGLHQTKAGNRNTGDSIFNQFKRKHVYGKDTIDGSRSIKYSKNGKNFYSGSSNGAILKWNIETRAYSVIKKIKGVIKKIDLSENEKYLLAATEQNTFIIINLSNPDQAPITVKDLVGSISDVSFLGNNSFITTGDKKKISVVSIDGGTELRSVDTNVKISSLDISPDGKYIVGGGLDKNLYMWDIKTLAAPKIIGVKAQRAISEVKFSPDGKYLVYGDLEGNIIIWDIEQSQRFGYVLKCSKAPVSDIAFSPDSRLLLATSLNKQIRMWDMNNIYDLPIVLDDYKDWVNDATFSSDGKFFITASQDGIIRKYPVDISELSKDLCSMIKGDNISESEWNQYVGEEIPYEKLCNDKNKKIDN